MAKKTDLQVIDQMCTENKDIRMSGTVVETKKVKQGGLITIGVDDKTLLDVSLSNEYYVALYVINKKQFNEIKGNG